MKNAAFRTLAVWALALASLAGTASVAAAATPVKTACFGESVSMDAKAGGATFAAVVSGYAHSDGGVGKDVQNVQAGLVDDADFPNTCN